MVDVFRDTFVPFGDDILFGTFCLFFFGLLVLIIRILQVENVTGEAGDANIDMFGRVKPGVPEPIKVDSGRVFHAAEEIGGLRAFEHPAPTEAFESIVENLTPEDRFAEDGQSCRGLAVGIGSELKNRFGVGHDRALVGARHVTDDISGSSP